MLNCTKNEKIKPTLFTILMIFQLFAQNSYSLAATEINSLTPSDTHLSSGYYTVSGKVELAAPPGKSALWLNKDDDVTIEITENASLKVVGGDASGQNGAGAGICVPNGARLTIKGKGTLIAYGGNAANGGSGISSSATSVNVNKLYVKAGAGGSGGDGGGGAGAGIGGTGGLGGNGGIGGPAVGNNNEGVKNGENGSNGENGLDGQAAGQITIYNSLVSDIRSGSAGNQGSAGNSMIGSASSNFEDTNYVYGAGGGAGAGGHGGLTADNIGGGGGGGAGGPGGGSGASLTSSSSSDRVNPLDNPGGGGSWADNVLASPTKLEWGSNSALGGKAGEWESDGKKGSCESITIIKSLKEAKIDEIPRQTYTGSEIKPSIIVRYEDTTLTEGIDYDVPVYENNINKGKAKVTVTGKGNYFEDITGNFDIGEKELTNDMIEDISDQTYTGYNITPEVTIKDGESTLNKDTDYTLEYSNNINAGVASIKITGIGNYTTTDTITKTFSIGKKELTNDMIEDISDQTYTGSAITPKVTIKDGESTLNKDTDYTLEYSSNINAGVASIKITGIGNYTGTIIKKFNINGEASGDNQGVDTSDWGILTINNGIKNWVSENGTTSAIVEKGKTWLKEESIDHYDENGRPIYTSAWYGIENPLKDDGTYVFEPGSRFWVRWVNNEDSDWDTYYDQLDDKYKNDIDSGRLWIFLIGVTDPNGNEYKNFGATVPLYIQLGDDWDKNDLRAVFILKDVDEFFDKDKVSYVNFDELSESPMVGEFAKVNLSHFSLYGLYDSKDNNNETDNTAEPVEPTDSNKIDNDKKDNDNNNIDNEAINKDDQNQSETAEKDNNDLDSNELGINSLDENLYDWAPYSAYYQENVNSDPFQSFQYKNTGNILPANFCNIILLGYCLYWLKKCKF